MASNLFAVLFVFALLAGAIWLARRKGVATIAWRLASPGAGSRRARLQVLERVPLTGQHSLHLVSCDGKLIVVAASPSGCSTLTSLSGDLAQGQAGGGGR